MKKVFKYDVAIDDYQIIEMPKGAKILKVDRQGENIKMWALVDPNAEKEQHYFRLAGTGHEIDDEEAMQLKYIGTCVLYDGRAVYHLFEIRSWQQTFADSVLGMGL